MHIFKIIPLLLFFGMLSSYHTYAQYVEPKMYKLFVNLDKAPFDSLYLYDYTDGKSLLIPGEKTKAFTWKITIPQALKNDENMVLLASPFDDKNNSKQQIRFIRERAGQKVVFANLGVEGENNFIYGIYIDTAVFPNEGVIIKINNKDTSIVGNLICADFNLIIKNPNDDIAVRSLDPLFSWFIDLNGKEVIYENHLASYIKLSKEYPDSRFLLSNLANNLTQYKSKSDVKKVYVNFSEKHKNTIWAKRIEQFLHEMKFSNSSLPTVNKNGFEKIIQDTTKYNLVVFTASWCKPCIEEIPILQKIYEDLNKDLIITYVSVDDEKGVTSFEKLLKEKNILWRSLFAYQDINKVKKKYFIEGIPKSILVYPNQEMEVLDIRNDEDRLKLYHLTAEKK